MSTHGGPVKGLVRHVRLFGSFSTALIGFRVVQAKLLSTLTRPGKNRPNYSIRQVSAAWSIPFHAVARINSEEFHRILDLYMPELLVSLSCPQVISKKVRQRIPKGCINVHGSPLPKYRGLMPAFWVLCKGETRTAVTVHDLEAKLDDGDILIQREVEIAPDETWDSLVRKTKRIGAEALVEAVRQIETGTVVRKPNRQEEATYYSFPTIVDRRAFLAAGRRFF
jgi:methionyl-tRNA formyltransferase